MRKIYTTPPASILQDPPTVGGSSTVYDGHSLAQFLSHLTPCTFVDVVTAPQITTYRFNLLNPWDAAKLGRIPAAVQAATNNPCTLDKCPGDASFALQMPSLHRGTVPFKQALLTRSMDQGRGLTALVGVDSNNTVSVVDLASMPHTLIAGGSGSGKSVMLNSLITSLLYKHTPHTLQLMMIDPKQVELTQYDGIPHLWRPVITDPAKAVQSLSDAVREMEHRYRIMRRERVVSAEGLFPRLLIVVDELADLMQQSKKGVEESISRIAYKGRAAGVHLLLATQRPTVNMVSGAIKANIQCRICLKVASTRDSINIIDRKGGETLLGKGDALLQLPTRPDPIRIQGAWISPEDIRCTVEYWTK